jgi:RNA polymerase sigma factor (sigma-70 family)
MGVERINGEGERFDALFRANSRAVLGYALRRTARPEDAADVLSETMLTAWRRLGSAPGDGGERFWLIGIARRVLANQTRSAVRRTRLGERLRTEVADACEEDFADWVQTRSVVTEALRRLAPKDREIVLLTTWDGLTPSEAARVLELRPAAARTRLHRARARLRRELGPHFDLEPGPAEALSRAVPRIEEDR